MADWKKQPSAKELLPRLEQWYGCEPGKRLLQLEQELIDAELTSCFGYHLLQLSVCCQINLYNSSRVQKKFTAHPLVDGDNPHCAVRCHFDELPFAENSMDVVVLHHVQEFVANPHEVLREVQRIVIPNGHVIIVGFNPWSLMGLSLRCAGLWADSLWHNHWLSSHRMTDWLSLLGFKVTTVKYAFHRPPLRRTALFDRLSINRSRRWQQWPLGGVYMICAVKEVAAMIPTKPRWASRKAGFAGLAPIKPSAGSVQPRNHQHNKEYKV